MVSFTSAALLGLAAVGSLAAPQKRWSNSKCMTGAEAQQVADNYAELIRDYSVTLANEALTPDFNDYSESVNSLINTCPQGKAAKAGPVPLLNAAFDTRAKFENGQSQQPPINFKQLNLEYNCNFLTIRWETTNTAPIPTPRPVVGLIMIEVEQAPSGSKYPWLVKTVYSEFDSAAWLQNLEEAGICSLINSGSPQLPLPSGTVAPPPPPPASATASGSAAPASASATASGSWTASASASASSSWTGSGSAPAYSTTASGSASATASGSYAASSAAVTSSAAAYSASAAPSGSPSSYSA